MNICHSLNSILVSSAELPCPVRLPFKEVSQLFLAAFCKLDGFGTYLFIAVSIERQSGHKSSSLPCIYRVYLNIYRDLPHYIPRLPTELAHYISSLAQNISIYSATLHI